MKVDVIMLLLRGWRNVAVEVSSAVCDANLGVKDERRARVERDGGLDDDLSHRVHQWILSEIPYLARQLSVFRLGNLPRGAARRD